MVDGATKNGANRPNHSPAGGKLVTERCANAGLLDVDFAAVERNRRGKSTTTCASTPERLAAIAITLVG